MKQILCVAAALLLATAGAAAHHSYADFEDRTVSIEGTVEKILFANPHVVLTVRTRDAQAYTVTWNSSGQLTRQGVDADAIRVGDLLVVSGSPSRKGPEIAKVSEVRRPSDGWAWKMSGGAITVTPSRRG